jgi:hypothetical protein
MKTIFCIFLLTLFAPIALHADPIPVKIAVQGHGFQLLRGSKPYFVKGAGGDGSKPLLHDLGGNSFRTWGTDTLDTQLAEAQKLGLTVTAGIWLGHKEYFNYHDPAQVAAQKEIVRKTILRYRDAPALLIWALGNEMEVGVDDDMALWTAIEDLAKMAHQLDPNHPTMTVVAEIGGSKIKHIHALCPDIDIVGINTYAGGSSIASRYQAAGGVKPYILTEYGPPGVWELKANSWGAVPEPSSTEKAKLYQGTYEKSIAAQPLCLGSYAFTWGNKQEATATWFGLLLPDGSRLGATDALTQLWTGKPPLNLCPEIRSLQTTGPDEVPPGAKLQATLTALSPQKSPLTVQWVLQADAATYHTGGGAEGALPTYPEAIMSSTPTAATIQMPIHKGGYRLFATVRDTHGGAAVANVPLYVQRDTPPTPAQKAALPLVLYGPGAKLPLPFAPTGYMGNLGAIQMDPVSTDHPRIGKTCLHVTYSANDNWGGVVWQSPANDWGDHPGGWDVTGAKSLAFWARGVHGGEAVTFQFGLLGKDKTYPDTATGKLDKVLLTSQWKRYTIGLSGMDLSRIKTGFSWVVAGSGQPVTFYLDSVQYE